MARKGTRRSISESRGGRTPRPQSSSEEEAEEQEISRGFTAAPIVPVIPPAYPQPVYPSRGRCSRSRGRFSRPRRPPSPLLLLIFLVGLAQQLGLPPSPVPGSSQTMGNLPMTGSNLSHLISQVGLAARPGLNPGVQYPVGGPPMTLHEQFQSPAARSTGASRQGSEAGGSPSVQRPGGRASPRSGTESERARTRGSSVAKTKEFDDPSKQVEIRLDGKYFDVLSPHKKVKKHGDVVSDIGAIVSSNFPSCWYKWPAENQNVPNDYTRDDGYLWPSMINTWLASLWRRYRWSLDQHDAIMKHFQHFMRERLSRMINKGREGYTDEGHPKWAKAEQWAEILRRISNDSPYLATCELNKKNRNAQGSSASHRSGRTPHRDRIADAVAKNDGKSLTFSQQLMLTHGKKGQEYDPTIQGGDAPVVDMLQPFARMYYEAGARMWGPDDRTWPPNWEEQILAPVSGAAYHGNVLGFASRRPVDVRAPRRRGRAPGISIGVPPAGNAPSQESFEKLQERNAALSAALAELLARRDAGPLTPAQEAILKIHEQDQTELQERRDMERARELSLKARWEEEQRLSGFYSSTAGGASSSNFAGGVPAGEYHPTFGDVDVSPPTMFDQTHISETPQPTGYRDQVEEEDDSETE